MKGFERGGQNAPNAQCGFLRWFDCLFWWCRVTPGIQWLRSSGPLSLGELGHGLGALRHGVLRELTRQDQADRRLDVAAADGATLVGG